MGQRREPGVNRENAADQEMRDQEVLRANKELAAYFKGQRTGREARAALKIIKAFVRDRERRDARSRPPLPGADVAKTPKKVARRKAASAGGERRKPRRKHHDKSSRSVTASIEPQDHPKSRQLPESDEPTSE